jgi:phage FluMu gp28-like protein
MDIFRPSDLLLPYQKAWAIDGSRWKFGLMARQVGKDFSAAFEGIADCAEAEAAREKVDWLIASPSERQSLESLQKWKDWAEVFKLSLAGQEESRDEGGQSLLKAATITFPHGSRVIAVPGRPETVRGFSANILLTEFAFFEEPDATWRALSASVANSMRGGVKKIRLITTPNGIGNKAHDIWAKNYQTGGHARQNLTEGHGGNGEKENSSPLSTRPLVQNFSPLWSCHLVDIHSAAIQGLGVNVAELKEALDDPEGWAQEFECQFLDVQATLLPYELIATCESTEATAVVAPEFWQSALPSPLVMGLDFGRRHDLTVAWTLRQLGDVQQTVEVLEMDRTPTPEQVEHLRPRLRRVRRVCVDYTGPGVGLGDFLAKEFGVWDPPRHKFGKIELCTFTNPLKLEIFSKLRMAFEKRGVRVPVNRVIREDLHSVNRVTSPSGQITYRAPHSADGHADRCTALALALRAAGDGAIRARSESVAIRPSPRDMGLGRFHADRWPW